VRGQGAAGDGRTVDTAAIQAAIDACGKEASGGVVALEDDRQYLTGTLRLASGVRLRVPANTTLLASLQVPALSGGGGSVS
jgi:polygalacturonase